MFADGPGRESLSGSLLVSSMEQVVGMFCMGRRGGQLNGVSILCRFLRIGELGVPDAGYDGVSLVSGGSEVDRRWSPTM